MARPSDEPQPTPMPTSGLVFYAPLVDSDAPSADTGQAFTYVGSSPTETVKDGIQCLYFNGSNYIKGPMTDLPTGSHAASISVWLYADEMTYLTGWKGVVFFGSLSSKRCMRIALGDDVYGIWGGFENADLNSGVVSIGSWHHICFTQEGGLAKVYIDGVLKNSNTYTGINVNSSGVLSIAYQYNSNRTFLKGWVTAARIYDRALEEAEITTLAHEFTPHYAIIVNDLSFSLYQKNESYSISYSSSFPVTFEIIEGTLPSSITFNTSTGTFTGKGLTDADHTYTLKVRLTAENSDPAECNVTISTYKTARISLSNQSFSFISNKAENKSMTYTSDETVTFTVENGTLPSGMTLNGNSFTSNGQNTSAETQAVVIRATSPNNQTGVTATMTLTMQMNAIVCNAQTMKFDIEQGTISKAVAYSGSLNAVTDAVFSMTGTLPAGVTFDSSTGTFTSDGTQTADETASVSVTVSSSNGTSTAATATITLEVHAGAPAIPDDYVFYMPMTSNAATAETGQSLNYNGTPTATTVDGISCLNCNNAQITTTDLTNFPSGNQSFTFSCWAKLINLGYNYSLLVLGTNRSYDYAHIGVGQGNIWFNFITDSYVLNNQTLPTTWFNLLGTYDGTTRERVIYIDGTEVGRNTLNADADITHGSFIINFDKNNRKDTYLAACRVYDRVLTSAEIQALASELTPTT